MSVRQMHHVGVVVDDLDAAVAFFVELGLKEGDRCSVGGTDVDRIIGVDGTRSDVAFVETPDGVHRLELIAFRSPVTPAADLTAPSTTPGLRHLAYIVDDIEDVLARLRRHGAETVGELVRFGDAFRLCYVRGPAGIIVELAEEIA